MPSKIDSPYDDHRGTKELLNDRVVLKARTTHGAECLYEAAQNGPALASDNFIGGLNCREELGIGTRGIETGWERSSPWPI